MENFECISYQEFPKDSYTSAVCVLRFEGKYNVAFAKKLKKDGGHFWSPPNVGVTSDDNEKIYFDGFECDSKAFDKKVKTFLENVGKAAKNQSSITYYPSGMQSSTPLPTLTPSPTSMKEVVEQGELPF